MKKIKSLLCALSSLTIAMTSAMAALPTVYAAEDTATAVVAEENVHYVYAGLTWEEYWASEGVYAATDTSSSDVLDSHSETDKGGYDAVSRATTNHGLHRGSYQCIAYIETEDGSKIGVSYWTDKNKFVSTDGETITFNKGVVTLADGTEKTMTDYKVTGTKYVPVVVSDADYEDFCSKYTVVENGGSLVGGYSENQLSAYNYTSEVTADTNGLKTAVKNADGTYSFSARTTGTNSGIADTAQKKVADTVTATVKDGDGTYGEFLRVDLTGEGYGELGAAMQAVKWTYYGDDSTYSTAIQSYGTKFAADNWMHKSMGIQLGLTDSARCQLPEGTDGTGYWEVTVYALGYEDTTYQVKVGEDNLFMGYVYGTMNIPYSEFFAAEGTFENGVDAVSSATTSKFMMTEAGKLSEGTYNTQKTDADGNVTGGTIDGVVYPVAVSKVMYNSSDESKKAVLESYSFTPYEGDALETAPASYKVFTYDSEDGDIDFSKVQDETPVTTSDVEVTLETSTSYGDYQLQFGDDNFYDKTTEVFYAAVITTDDGKTYPMTILENWWRPKNELAWSIGFIGSESSKIHNANVLKYNETADLTDKTITSVTFITTSGYTTVNTNIYLPKKEGFDADILKVADSKLSDGKAAITFNAKNEDYTASYSTSSENLSVSDGNVVFGKDALPGKYTLTVEDTSGKNVSYNSSFIISADSAAATVGSDGKSIVAASGVSETEFSNYISNISTVKVGDQSYSASGKRGVKLVNEDGTLNASVNKTDKEGKVTTTEYIKDGDVVTISANGYDDITLTFGKATTTDVEVSLGDVNGDGKVDSKDAVVILQYFAESIVNKNNITVKADEKAADLNADGSIDSKDAVLVLQYFAESIVKGDNFSTVKDYVASKK